MRRIYKLLVSLHSDCTDILRLVKECGTVSRDIRDLEQQVDLYLLGISNSGHRLDSILVMVFSDSD